MCVIIRIPVYLGFRPDRQVACPKNSFKARGLEEITNEFLPRVRTCPSRGMNTLRASANLAKKEGEFFPKKESTDWKTREENGREEKISWRALGVEGQRTKTERDWLDGDEFTSFLLASDPLASCPEHSERPQFTASANFAIGSPSYLAFPSGSGNESGGQLTSEINYRATSWCTTHRCPRPRNSVRKSAANSDRGLDVRTHSPITRCLASFESACNSNLQQEWDFQIALFIR